jgi:hypothetical protein
MILGFHRSVDHGALRLQCNMASHPRIMENSKLDKLLTLKTSILNEHCNSHINWMYLTPYYHKVYTTHYSDMSWLVFLDSSLWWQRPGSEPRPVRVVLCGDKMALEQFLYQVLLFFPVSIIPSIPHTQVSFIYYHCYMILAVTVLFNKTLLSTHYSVKFNWTHNMCHTVRVYQITIKEQ